MNHILLFALLAIAVPSLAAEKKITRKPASPGERVNLMCYGANFRGLNENIAIVGRIKGPAAMEQLEANVGNEKYALPSDLLGVTYHQTDLDLRVPPTNYDKFVWPQDSLVWNKGDKANAKKTLLVLPKNLKNVPHIDFTAHLKDNDTDVLLVCSVEDDCVARGNCN